MALQKTQIKALQSILGAMFIMGFFVFVNFNIHNALAGELEYNYDVGNMNFNVYNATDHKGNNNFVASSTKYVDKFGLKIWRQTYVDENIDFYLCNDINCNIEYYHAIIPSVSLASSSSFYYIEPTALPKLTNGDTYFFIIEVPSTSYASRGSGAAPGVYNAMDFQIWTKESKSYGEATVEFYFPDDYYVIQNEEWTDWNIDYQLANSGWDYVLLRIQSDCADGQSILDYDYISTTTALTRWSMEKSWIPYGQVISTADILGTYLENCNDVDEYSCIWYSLGTDIITWTSSSSGYTLYNNPYLLGSGFSNASTSQDNWFSPISNTILKLFPFSVIFQIREIMWNIKETASSTNVLTYGDFVTDEIAGDASSSIVISAEMLKQNKYGNFWNTYVYNYLYYIIYALAFIYIIKLLFKKPDQE